jgi:hypothetical protein
VYAAGSCRRPARTHAARPFAGSFWDSAALGDPSVPARDLAALKAAARLYAGLSVGQIESAIAKGELMEVSDEGNEGE